MLRSIASVVVIVALAVSVTACGDDDSGSDDESSFGTGLELGSEVLNSAPAGSSVGPWYVWNNQACRFEVTEEHPKEYRAELRPVESDVSLGYMYYANADPYGIAVSKSVEERASEAGVQLDTYNLKFPSRTEPQAAAKSALVKENAGVMQANLDPTVLPTFFDVIEGEGCIPSIQMHIPVDDRPAMGNYFPDVGRVIGEYVGQEAQERGWDPAATALVQCTDPDNGPTVNVMFEEIPKAMSAEGFALPEQNVFDLSCKLTETQAGKKRVEDWFTGHPDFEHVAFTAIDSIRMVDMARAVEEEGRPDQDTILAEGQADERSRTLIRSGREDMAVAGFPERFGEWVIPMLQDAMAGEPIPSFVGTDPAALTKETLEKYYPGE